MPMIDKKNVAALIIGKLNKDGSETYSQPEMKDNAEQDYSIALHSAAEEMIQASQKGDVESFVSALKSFLSMCEEEKEDDEEMKY